MSNMTNLRISSCKSKPFSSMTLHPTPSEFLQFFLSVRRLSCSVNAGHLWCQNVIKLGVDIINTEARLHLCILYILHSYYMYQVLVCVLYLRINKISTLLNNCFQSADWATIGLWAGVLAEWGDWNPALHGRTHQHATPPPRRRSSCHQVRTFLN